MDIPTKLLQHYFKDMVLYIKFTKLLKTCFPNALTFQSKRIQTLNL